ncbi:MAG TPA: hypothetical protein VGX00_06850 [Thermoplasmata archaeon]|nr:hypothetical protein [Thermoplasmata archaeon]
MDLSAIANVAFAGIAVFGAALGTLAIAAWRRAPSSRMALVAAGFWLIAVQGVVVGVGLFTSGLAPATLLAITAGFEAALLLVLFVATLVR